MEASVKDKTEGIDQRVLKALEGQGEKVDELTDEQVERARNASKESHAEGGRRGLSGKGLVAYVLTGNGSKTQQQTSAPKTTKSTGKASGKGKASGTAKATSPGKVASKPKAEKYPAEIKAAAERATTLLRTGKDGRGAVPSPATHIKVREIVGKRLKKDGESVTPESVLKLSGIKTQKLLKECANWTAPREELRPLRTIAAETGHLSWAHGRYLAAILTVWIDDLKG